MPVKDFINFESGTLFMTPLDGGEPMELGPIRSIEVTSTRTDYVDDLGEPCPYVVPPMREEEWTFELESISLQALWWLTKDSRIVWDWARVHRPRLWHLSLYASRPRARKKNVLRIFREFIAGG